MSLYRIFPDDLEYFRLETNPKKVYSSSSLGITGSVHLYAFRSQAEKEVFPLSMFKLNTFDDMNLDSLRTSIALYSGSTNKQTMLQSYLNAVKDQGASARLEQQLFIERFTPPPVLNSNTLRKNTVREVMYPFYHSSYPRMQWNTTNYNSLNFFTDNNVPTSSVLIYMNPTWYDPDDLNKENPWDSVGDPLYNAVFYNSDYNSIKTQYQLSSSFTFDFWIKPTQQQSSDTEHYVPGGIFHMTGAYAITLHSGSAKDQNGLVDQYRLCFQYGRTYRPDLLTNGTNVLNQTDYGIVWSSDNALDRNKWSHVTVRWGGPDFPTGSIMIDSTVDTTFSADWYIDSNIVGDCGFQKDGSNALFVGNFYTGTADVSMFFPDPQFPAGQYDDIYYLNGAATYLYEQSYAKYLATTGSYPTLAPGNYSDTPPYEPTSFSFNFPLKAEVHELKIFDKMLTMPEIQSYQSGGVTNFDNLKFYVPPFFTYESPVRSNELLTPFQANVSASTDTPFGVKMAYGVWGHNINLDNYGRDFAIGNYPRLWNLEATPLDIYNGASDSLSANSFLYATGSNIKRLYTVMPCDNGNVVPNFKILNNYNTFRFANDLGNQDLGVISLNNMTVTSAYTASIALTEMSSTQPILGNILGPTPTNLTAVTASSLTLLHRLRDTSSNQVVFYDISNMFYGKQIKPGSVVLKDTAISGTNLTVTLKDDGHGNLYRADTSDNVNPTWASVGNVLYNEGIIVIKYPQLYFFGECQFQVEVKGTQNIHVMTLNATAQAGTLISSSNTTFSSSLLQKPDEDLYNEADQRFVYLTGLNIHDENLNVVMRTNLAQPIQKLSGDRIQFKNKLDF